MVTESGPGWICPTVCSKSIGTSTLFFSFFCFCSVVRPEIVGTWFSSASFRSNEVKTCTQPFRINQQLDMNLFFTLQLAINSSSLSMKAERVPADGNIWVLWFVLISPLQTRRNSLRLVRSSLIFLWLIFLLFCSFCLPQISFTLLPLDVP